ncbi:hypothetical protein DWY31_05570 [Dorea sp. AF24-7LB]|uniref:hypothetical protein n=1 Tax=Dorea TaxID=189330 RepID=UPI000E531D26|nr:hypothetical protein [Dorea sp. AF24-7LB]RHQ56041.1 hypothetical protein DWY31_05570 [Dorea sp. AF24-7LB]
MKILDDFYAYVVSQEIDKNAIYEERGDGFVVVSFPERGEKDCIYNIAIVFYENENDVEIYVRKPIKDFDELTLLRKLNTLNCEYTDVTFFVDDNMLTVKSYLSSQGKLENVLIKMVSDVQLAQTEFVRI